MSMARKYGPKASEKIGQTMHEFKRGKLKSGGSGKKVTSRKQAIAIGISQAARAGYKVPPPPSGHASMNLDARVRAYLSNMRPNTEIDARGIARALGGGIDPLEADYALERAEKAGLAVTSDGRWFGPANSGRVHHAKMLSARTELVERVTLPSGRYAEIHIVLRHGTGGYSGTLVFPNGNELPLSVGKPFTATDAMRNAKQFLAKVYGRGPALFHGRSL
jgi:hypothetical protein